MPDNSIDNGVIAYQQGNKAQANVLFTRAVKNNPNDAIAWYWLGKCQTDPEKVRYCFDRASRLDPQYLTRITPLERFIPPEDSMESNSIHDELLQPQMPIESEPHLNLTTNREPTRPDPQSLNSVEFTTLPLPSAEAQTPSPDGPAAVSQSKPQNRYHRLERVCILIIALLLGFLLVFTPISLLMTSGKLDAFIPVPVGKNQPASPIASNTPLPLSAPTDTGMSLPNSGSISIQVASFTPTLTSTPYFTSTSTPTTTSTSTPIQLAPTSVQGQIELLYTHADGYYQQGNYASEIQVLSRAIELDPQKAFSYERRGSIYLRMTDNLHSLSEYITYLNLAIQDFDTAISLGQKQITDWSIYSNRAIAYSALNQQYPFRTDREINYEIALENYKFAFQAGASEKALVDVVSQLIQLGRWEEASKLAFTLKADGVNEETLHGDLAVIYSMKGDHQKAIEEIDQLNKGCCQNYRQSVVYYNAGHKVTAFTLINENIQDSPSFAGYRYFMRALLYYEQGNYDLAWKDLQTGEGYTWGIYGLHDYVLGKLLIQDGNREAGIELIRRAEATMSWDMGPFLIRIQDELKSMGINRLKPKLSNPITATPMPSKEFRPTARPTYKPSSDTEPGEKLPGGAKYIRIVDPVKGTGPLVVFFGDEAEYFHFQPEQVIEPESVNQLVFHIQSPSIMQLSKLRLRIWSPGVGKWVFFDRMKVEDNQPPGSYSYMTKTGEIYIEIMNTGKNQIYLDNISYSVQVTLKDGTVIDYGLGKPLP